MPEEPPAPPKPAAEVPPEPVAGAPDPEQEKDVGDFITRHVLEKDSVFFEG